MDEFSPLRSLARAMGVATRYIDGRRRPVRVGPETLLRTCQALGAPIASHRDAPDALRALRAARAAGELAPVFVAWEGRLAPVPAPAGATEAAIALEDGTVVHLHLHDGHFHAPHGLPWGYHWLAVAVHGQEARATVISAPVQAYRRPGSHRSWGVGTHLAAIRTARSRSVGDLADFEATCRWVRDRGGDLVTALPLLPTFNAPPAEPSPYSPVSRLFWSELILDLGAGHRPVPTPPTVDVTAADREVRAALAGWDLPDPSVVDDQLRAYARFRGVQARLGRNWRDWPAEARGGRPSGDQVDAAEERFHLVAQVEARRQLHDLRVRLERDGMRVGLDLAVGVHPDGFDPWSRQWLFGDGMSVGAPPDQGFPSGQDWGFTPVLPSASRREGHRYIAASIGHQATLAGVLRVDHVMAWTRLYWIPHGLGLHQGTYVSYPAEELFAVLTLESNKHRCEVVGENLGTVPRDIFEALPRHRIWGMYLAMFMASDGPGLPAPTEADMALVGSHDTPTFDGWIRGNDIGERVRYRLLAPEQEPEVVAERARAVRWLAARVGQHPDRPYEFLAALLEWLGRSASPLVVPWLEDFWLEPTGVNLPGTPSSVRPNWQRPMARLLEDWGVDPAVDQLARRLAHARATGSAGHHHSS